MAKNRMLGLVLAFAIAGSLQSGADAKKGGCKQDYDALVKQCSAYVQKSGPPVPPSARCCSVIQHADIPCICEDYITPKVEKLISMEKVVYVMKQCGRPFKHGSKCGSRITSHVIISVRKYNFFLYFILSTITSRNGFYHFKFVLSCTSPWRVLLA